MTADVQQFDVLQIVPEPLHRIKFWRVAWQPQERNPAGCTTPHIVLHRAILDRGSIPNDQQFPHDVMQQVFENAPHLVMGYTYYDLECQACELVDVRPTALGAAPSGDPSAIP